MRTFGADRPRRDAGINAFFFGFFASAWFGWAQADPVGSLANWLNAASLVGLLVAIVGAVVGFRAPAASSALRAEGSMRRYGIIVGIEFGLAFVGAFLLGLTGLAEFIPVWVCVVVGVHFFPLAPLLGDPWLGPLGVATCLVALAGLVVGLTTEHATSAVVGIGAGLLLLGYGVASLTVAFLRERVQRRA